MNAMTNKSVAVLAIVLALTPYVCGVSAQPSWTGPTEPFHYSLGFEDGADPVRFWTSYKKTYTVNFKGVTDEKARSDKRSFKLDVTLDQAGRFLWRIALPKKVPAEGVLDFSGYMLVAEGSTAKATLGVEFALPPSAHTGCTAPGALWTTTEKWQEIREELVYRGKERAQLVTGSQNWGVQGENVGAVVEGIIIDINGQAGQRVVLYVDDLEIKGRVPSDEAYQEELLRRWAPVMERINGKITAWETALGDYKRMLSSLTELSPRAENMRRDMLEKLQGMKDRVAEVKEMGREIKKHVPSEIDTFLACMEDVTANIEAVSVMEQVGGQALVYDVPPISPAMILPADLYVPGKPSRSLSIVAAPGEYEPASFVVSPSSDIQSLRVTVSDLRSDRGTISASCVNVKTVKCWYQAGTAWVGIRQDKSRRILTPELLLNDDTLVRVDTEKKENYIKLNLPDGEKYEWISDPTEISSRSLPVNEFPVRDSPVLLPVDVPAGKNKQFWLTVHVPTEAGPGIYRGTIALDSPNASPGDLTLTVEVLPFELLPPYYTSSIDYHGRLVPDEKAAIGSWSKSREQFRNELADMVAHGLRNCQHYGIRKDILGDVLKIRAEVGMDNRTLYLKNTIPIGNPTDPEALETIKYNVRDIIGFTRAYGTEVVYFYGIDERQGEELVVQRPAWEAVREAGGRIFVAGGGDNIKMMGDIQDMHVRAGPPDREEVAKWHAYGHRIFCYANPQTGVENPVVYRRNFGLLLWKYDYDGAATNAYQHTFGATWNDFDHPSYRAHTIAYPTANGVIDTIAWEGYREGVDDVRYITTLEKAVEAAEKSGESGRSQTVAEAKSFLHDLKTGARVETDNLDTVRRDIITHILKVPGHKVPAEDQ